jgi:Putative Flp pilus-assembly TadE/G-like
MGVLMAVLALVTDGGILLVERRHAQATADAAALAAATDLYTNWNTNQGSDPSSTAQNSALGVASANGYTNDGTTSTVTVSIPPTSGTFANKAGYVEVDVTYNVPRGFSGVFGSGAIPVSARAVARGVVQGSTAAVLLLSPNASPALSATGNGSLTVAGGSVVVDSTDSNAVSVSGNAALTAPRFVIAGNDTISQNGTITTNPTANNVQTNANQMPNPLSYLPTPATSGLTTQSSSALSITGTATLLPGVYVGGITISINASVTLQAGTYYMEGGGFTVKGNASVDGSSGVMLYNDGGSGGTISISGNGNVSLSPETSGPYAGIVMFQAPTSTSTISITGNGSSTNITGTIYAADAKLIVGGNGSQIGSQYIVSTLTLSGNGLVNVDYGSNTSASERDLGLVQ